MDYILKKTVEIPDAELKKNDKFYILVNLFIKKGSPDLWQPKDWVREKFATKKLMNKYKDFDFFYSLNHLQGKFNSLLGLMSKKYHNLDTLYGDYIRNKERKKTFTLNDNHSIILDDVPRKPKNLMEYLDS